MAGFCSKCGKPLPENGAPCPCSPMPQTPPAAQIPPQQMGGQPNFGTQANPYQSGPGAQIPGAPGMPYGQPSAYQPGAYNRPAGVRMGGNSITQLAGMAIMGSAVILFLLTFIGFWVEGSDNPFSKMLYFSFPGVFEMLLESLIILAVGFIGFLIFSATTKGRSNTYIVIRAAIALGVSGVFFLIAFGINADSSGFYSFIHSIGWAIEEADDTILPIFESIGHMILWGIIFVGSFLTLKERSKN